MPVSEEAKLLYKKAKECYNNCKYEKAKEFFEKALEIEPNYPEAISLLAFTHSKLNFKFVSKKEFFNMIGNALSLNPDQKLLNRMVNGCYEYSLERKLNVYKKIDAMILNQAKGYDIAYEIEKNKEDLDVFPTIEPIPEVMFYENYKKISELARDYKRDIIPLDSTLVKIIKGEIEILEENLKYLKLHKRYNI